MPDTNEKETNETPDVAPPVALQTLALLWIALFGGRWIVVSLLQWNGLLAPERVGLLDTAILSRCYLILLAITILILALRGARLISRPTPESAQTGRAALSASAPNSRQESRKRD